MHLIECYNFFFCRKLSQYSPNDTSKAFDRQVNRRSNVKFNPRQTIEILKLGDPPANPDDEHKLDLVRKYMEVKKKNALIFSLFFNNTFLWKRYDVIYCTINFRLEQKNKSSKKGTTACILLCPNFIDIFCSILRNR